MGIDNLELFNDEDPEETKEWLESLSAVYNLEGKERVNFLLKKIFEHANSFGCSLQKLTTPYRNTIPVCEEASIPGNVDMERRIRSLIRWNAVAMVVRANNKGTELGGHLGSFASSATLLDVGFNYFWNAPNDKQDGDLVYFPGHHSPGIYSRAFLEGRISEDQIDNFRQEVSANGLSSYPHSWLMPEFWQFPTVSLGLGPLQAIYQARFMHYMQARNLKSIDKRKVWCFCGDGEMDEPESLSALSIAARENLDNLIFVINCNLQRLDGPVRGNGKVIQELEGIFRGAGWNVIKVVWGSCWDSLLNKDKSGLLQKRMDEAVDGEYQAYKAEGGGKLIREHFFGKYPELAGLIENYTDEDLFRLRRGGHDVQKVYAAYKKAAEHKDQPTVILAKTIKGYGLGKSGEGLNIAHNVKKMAIEQLKNFRDRFDIPISDKDIEKIPFYRPPEDSPEIKYMQKQRERLGGYLPKRRLKSSEKLKVPKLEDFSAYFTGTGDKQISTTMAYVRILASLCKDKIIGKRIVPIVADEARTLGMESYFRQLGIYSPKGQLYVPVDRDEVMYYKEAKEGQVLEEGITECGSFASWLAAATSYSAHNYTMIPFYTYYSMFGFQRIGDLLWAAGDVRARGFLVGGTSGRTTLNGEGLQHQDGQSHAFASIYPTCVAYDPTFAYELAVILQNGLERMVENQEDIFFYITVTNEVYEHPAMPKEKDVVDGIIKGMYKYKKSKKENKLHVQLLGSGSILRESIFASELLEKDFNVSSTVWSVTSFNNLAADGRDVVRWNMLHPSSKQKIPYVTKCVESEKGPVVAATDYVKQYVEQVSNFIPRTYMTLGTNGYGRSDSRSNLRSFFEVDRYYIVIAALKSLLDDGLIKPKVVEDAIKKYKIQINKENPVYI